MHHMIRADSESAMIHSDKNQIDTKTQRRLEKIAQHLTWFHWIGVQTLDLYCAVWDWVMKMMLMKAEGLDWDCEALKIKWQLCFPHSFMQWCDIQQKLLSRLVCMKFQHRYVIRFTSMSMNMTHLCLLTWIYVCTCVCVCVSEFWGYGMFYHMQGNYSWTKLLQGHLHTERQTFPTHPHTLQTLWHTRARDTQEDSDAAVRRGSVADRH